MKRYVVRQGTWYWSRWRVRSWFGPLKAAVLYKTRGRAQNVANQLRAIWAGADVVPVCVDRLGRVRRLSA